jgi:hypothetical protein
MNEEYLQAKKSAMLYLDYDGGAFARFPVMVKEGPVRWVLRLQ